MDNERKKALFRFRRWPVYQAAKSFRKRIKDLAKRLPESERYLLRDQISRAVDSICLNIAEGSNKLSDIDFIHSDINHDRERHSCESRNPGRHWIPGQARNDKVDKIYVVMYSRYLNNSETSLEEVVCCLDLILDDGYIRADEFNDYIKEAETLGAQLIAFGKKLRKDGIRL